MITFLTTVMIFFFSLAASAEAADNLYFDVAVIGGGTGGSMAAIQAARMGMSVALIEQSDWVGGQMTGAAVSTIDDVRRTRNYTWQPPTVPHRVDGYQVDKNFNKCMDCHSRTKAEVSQAVPVSVTHYMDRDGHMLGQVSTRRYFCMQCHVSQDAVRPLVNNTFQDVDALIMKSMQSSPGAAAAKKH